MPFDIQRTEVACSNPMIFRWTPLLTTEGKSTGSNSGPGFVHGLILELKAPWRNRSYLEYQSRGEIDGKPIDKRIKQHYS